MVVRKVSVAPSTPSNEVPSDLLSALICGVVENRAKEVGIAAVDLSNSTVSLMQFVEVSRTYTTVKGALHVLRPSLLVTLSSNRAVAAHDINKATRLMYQQVPLGRAAFDDTKAALTLEKLAATSIKANLDSALMRSRYYLALGAAGAVLQYIEQELGSVLTAGCLDLQFQSITDRMQIDLASIQALELIEPLAYSPGADKANRSLFNRLKYTKTVAGAQLLRVRYYMHAHVWLWLPPDTCIMSCSRLIIWYLHSMKISHECISS